MANYSTNFEYMHLIDFVRPGHGGISNSTGRLQSVNITQSQVVTRSYISGDEAKGFYESLCQESLACRKLNAPSEGYDNTYSHKRKPQKRPRPRDVVTSDDLAVDFCPGQKKSFVSKCGNSEDTESNHNTNTKKYGAKETVSSASKRRKFSTDKKPALSQRVKDHRQSELFRLAQQGDSEGVGRLLQQGVAVNGVDHFGWTPAMAAACEGHTGVLQVLVKHGADLTVTNSQGYSARSLAHQKHHANVVKFVDSYNCTGRLSSPTKLTKKLTTSFYCDVCKAEFTDTDPQSHLRSTLHIFNTGSKPKEDPFLIPPSNVGYRLMVKTGWDGNKGLGPSGDGKRFPVKTLLKRDRKGLGNKVAEKAKVTHFKAKDKSAVYSVQSGAAKREANLKTLSRRDRKRKEKIDRQKEIELRHQLS